MDTQLLAEPDRTCLAWKTATNRTAGFTAGRQLAGEVIRRPRDYYRSQIGRPDCIASSTAAQIVQQRVSVLHLFGFRRIILLLFRILKAEDEEQRNYYCLTSSDRKERTLKLAARAGCTDPALVRGALDSYSIAVQMAATHLRGAPLPARLPC